MKRLIPCRLLRSLEMLFPNLSESCLCRSHEEGEGDQNMSLLRDQSLLISGGGVGGFLADHMIFMGNGGGSNRL